MISNAFTCTGPYAILIMAGIKRVENRSVCPVPASGRCAVSCSKKFNRAEHENFMLWTARVLPPGLFCRLPTWGEVKGWPGRIIGACDYAARMRVRPDEPWDEGYPYWWDLSNATIFGNPIQCRGNVGMWRMPPDLAALATAADQVASLPNG